MAYSPRQEWTTGLQPKRVIAHPQTARGGKTDLIVLHHTVTPDAPFFDMLRSVERYHLGRQYYDIAYNGAASNSSDDYTDLRGPQVQGGATGNGVDAYSLSIVVPGDFQTSGKDRPRPVVVENVARLIARWHSQGFVSDNFRIGPHRDFYQTSCCGDRLLRLIPQMEARAREIIAAGGVPVGGDDDVIPFEEWKSHYNALEHGNSPDGVVEFIQDRLTRLGYDVGDIDGVRGVKTDEAWTAFEADQFPNGTHNAKPGRYSWERFLSVQPVTVTETVEVVSVPEGVAEALAVAQEAAAVVTNEVGKARFIVNAHS